MVRIAPFSACHAFAVLLRDLRPAGAGIGGVAAVYGTVEPRPVTGTPPSTGRNRVAAVVADAERLLFLSHHNRRRSHGRLPVGRVHLRYCRSFEAHPAMNLVSDTIAD